MRKWWYAGAALAGGVFLFGAASPAQADLLPLGTGTVVQQADQRLAYVLGEPNGAKVENPLRYSTMKDSSLGGSPIVQFRSGKNSPDLNPMLPGETDADERPGLPKTDLVGSPEEPRLQLQQLPISDLVGDRGQLVTTQGLLPTGDTSPGLLPSTGTSGLGLLPQSDPTGIGLLPAAGTTGSDEPLARRTESGVPLLGGLGGLRPVNSLPGLLPAGTVPDTSGLPGGGLTMIPADSPDPGFGISTKKQPTGGEKPKSAAVPDDPRLHEEPIDGEHRSFTSDARPVAGVDREYK